MSDKIFDEALAVEQEKGKEKAVKAFTPILLKDISEEKTNYDWLWENIIARGHKTLLTALFKSGKSTFIRCLIKAMSEEAEFPVNGFSTKKCRVLVVSEESETEWKSKAPDFGLDEEDLPLWIAKPSFYGKSNKKQWMSFINGELLNFCLENKIDLVIFDTVSKIWPVDKENDAGETGAALGVLDVLIDNNIALLVVQQSSKQAAEFGADVRGSSEIGGWPDEIIVFSRLKGDNQNTRRRLVDFYGRLYNSEETDMVIELDHNNQYHYKGSKYQFSTIARKEVIVDILSMSDQPLSVREIRDIWDDGLFGSKPSHDSITRYLNAMSSSLVRSVDEITVKKAKTPRWGNQARIYAQQLPEINATQNPLYSQPSALRSVNNATQRSSGGSKDEL